MKAGGRLAALLLLVACGSAPPPRERPPARPIPAPEAPAPDPCALADGTPPAPLAKAYHGVLKRARCQAEVLTIMQGVAKALGVDCTHCHDAVDYAKGTPKKEVANWMASELIPRLAKRGGGTISCADCHADDGKGKARILGAPRSRQRAVEWMTVRLVEGFEAAAGGPLYCATCHVGRLGDPRFDGRVILTDHLPPLPVSPPPSGVSTSPLGGTEALPHDDR